MKNYHPRFLEHYRTVIKRTPNVKNPLNAQKLTCSHQEELFRLFCERPSDYYSISRQLNDKKKLTEVQLDHGHSLDVYLNMNSKAFLRDSNYSISLSSEEFGEIGILSFEPEMKNSLLITQIQSKYGKKTREILPVNWRDLLFYSFRDYAEHLKFNELLILRAEWNLYFTKPNHLRKDRTLEEHQQSMIMTYNVTPRRRWGFEYEKNDLVSRLSLK